jgi:NADH:ubiquinone oxidoreductase subunit 6 (subunit J)
MSTPQIIFYCFAGLTVLSALFMLFSKNVLHAVIALLAVFLGVSAMYVFAGADFLAITQLVVYVGGVLVLMLFGVMLTNRESGAIYPVSRNKYFLSGLFAGASILTMLIYLINKNEALFAVSEDLVAQRGSSLRVLGVSLMSEYILVFEVAGLLLLVALIGASFIAAKK